jgi:hypothetical protein
MAILVWLHRQVPSYWVMVSRLRRVLEFFLLNIGNPDASRALPNGNRDVAATTVNNALHTKTRELSTVEFK